MSGDDERGVDAALTLTELAADALMSAGGDAGLLLARRCLEVQDLLVESGAVPGAPVAVRGGEGAVELLRRAEAELDGVLEAERATWGPARVELRALVVEALGD